MTPVLFTDDDSDPLPVIPQVSRLGPWYICTTLAAVKLFRQGTDVTTIMQWTGDSATEVMRRLKWHEEWSRVVQEDGKWIAIKE